MTVIQVPKAMVATLCAVALLCGLTLARAADETKTITGEAKCAKCQLKQGEEHQTAIEVKEGGQTVTYYLVNNAAAKALDQKVCGKSQQVTATGTVKEVNGKRELTATEVKVAGQSPSA